MLGQYMNGLFKISPYIRRMDIQIKKLIIEKMEKLGI
ncbi:hypothetical protein HNQ88_001977 [Aureibacter tunicatorum]|uniref:Uncharacterized protein n=1 Tax=Aureibacter tunicatorum TaxID=866807 RepID=A0AAE3XM01_9BACT|nr:hypothetical protein [Aureibacter tunicatorum]BDD05134.1 hypothetical protein AUTU_26170 [Aureibacter tunicatorum]